MQFRKKSDLRGAEMIARRIKPDVAIITDVTHDTATPMVNKLVEGDMTCGKGPSLAFGPAVHNKLLSFVRDTAAKKNIPVQLRAVSRSTGTDTDSFAYANEGCPSVLISIPLRYMHTTVEMLNRKDIEQTILLMYETLLATYTKNEFQLSFIISVNAKIWIMIRNNWTKEEIQEIYELPLLELVYRAATVHRSYNNTAEVQVCTLLSVKTGGCSEDCAYCPQAARYHTDIRFMR